MTLEQDAFALNGGSHEPPTSENAHKIERFKTLLIFCIDNIPEVRSAVRRIFLKGKRNVELKPLSRNELIQRLEHIKPLMYKGRPIAYPSAKVTAEFNEYTKPEVYEILAKAGILIRKNVQKWVGQKQIRCVLLDLHREE